MAITPSSNLNSVAASQQQALASNYIDFRDQTTAGWAQTTSILRARTQKVGLNNIYQT